MFSVEISVPVSSTTRKVTEVILSQVLINFGPFFESVVVAHDYPKEIFVFLGTDPEGYPLPQAYQARMYL